MLIGEFAGEQRDSEYLCLYFVNDHFVMYFHQIGY